ncbi:MAG: hypothetical protein ABDI07_11375, partial [Candidatus Kryptonium sp.]
MRRGLILFLIYFLFVGVVFTQQVKKWDRGAGTDNWSDAGNWDSDGVPGPDDDVVLDNTYVSGNYTINLPTGTVEIGALEISPDSGVTITIIGSSDLIVAGNLVIGFDATLSSNMTGDLVFKGSNWNNFGTFTT